MTDRVADMRRDYGRDALDETHASDDPFEQFAAWFAAAEAHDPTEANAMCLSTVTSDGRPRGRMVLLKAVDHGFVFYTNYDSAKGQELDAHPYAALTFYWPHLERSVRIEGRVARVSAAESDAYFSSRPRGSRVGAWASPQSAPVAGREELEARVAAAEARFGDDDEVPRPDGWGGYRVVPERIEFWQGRSNRLHDRLVYERAGQVWERGRLAP